MAFAEIGSLGATGSTTNNITSLALTTTATAVVGSLIVVVIADDNISAGADADGNEIASVADSAGNTYIKARGWSANQAAAQAGAAVAMWYTVVTTQLTSGGTITATFTSGPFTDACAMTARNFSFAGGTTIGIEATNTQSGTAADPASLDATTANIACLRIRGIAGEVGTTTSLTPTASWTAWANGNSATSGGPAEMCARAEHIISTGTGAASDPTWVASDNASVYVAFKEVAGVTTFPQTVTVAATSTVTHTSAAGKLVAATCTSAVTRTMAIGKLVAALATSSVVITGGQLFTRTVTVAATTGVELSSQIGKLIAVTATTAVAVTRLRVFVKTIVVTATTSVVAFSSRAFLETIVVTATSSVALRKAVGFAVDVPVDTAVAVRKAVGQAIAITVANAVTLRKSAGQVIAATVTSAVSVLRVFAAYIPQSLVYSKLRFRPLIRGKPKIVEEP